MVQAGSRRGDVGPTVLFLSAQSQMEFQVDPATAMVLVDLSNEGHHSVRLGFTGTAAVRFAEQLRYGFEQLCREQGTVGDDGGRS